jgi:hypothetical protein
MQSRNKKKKKKLGVLFSPTPFVVYLSPRQQIDHYFYYHDASIICFRIPARKEGEDDATSPKNKTIDGRTNRIKRESAAVARDKIKIKAKGERQSARDSYR